MEDGRALAVEELERVGEARGGRGDGAEAGRGAVEPRAQVRDAAAVVVRDKLRHDAERVDAHAVAEHDGRVPRAHEHRDLAAEAVAVDAARAPRLEHLHRHVLAAVARAVHHRVEPAPNDLPRRPKVQVRVRDHPHTRPGQPQHVRLFVIIVFCRAGVQGKRTMCMRESPAVTAKGGGEEKRGVCVCLLICRGAT